MRLHSPQNEDGKETEGARWRWAQSDKFEWWGQTKEVEKWNDKEESKVKTKKIEGNQSSILEPLRYEYSGEETPEIKNLNDRIKEEIKKSKQHDMMAKMFAIMTFGLTIEFIVSLWIAPSTSIPIIHASLTAMNDRSGIPWLHEFYSGDRDVFESAAGVGVGLISAMAGLLYKSKKILLISLVITVGSLTMPIIVLDNFRQDIIIKKVDNNAYPKELVSANEIAREMALDKTERAVQIKQFGKNADYTKHDPIAAKEKERLAFEKDILWLNNNPKLWDKKGLKIKGVSVEYTKNEQERYMARLEKSAGVKYTGMGKVYAEKMKRRMSGEIDAEEKHIGIILTSLAMACGFLVSSVKKKKSLRKLRSLIGEKFQ